MKKDYRIDDMPDEVWWVFCVTATSNVFGSTIYNRIIKAYKDYPDWFPNEHAYYHVVPKEVHGAYRLEVYGPEEPFDWDAPRVPLIDQIENKVSYPGEPITLQTIQDHFKKLQDLKNEEVAE